MSRYTESMSEKHWSQLKFLAYVNILLGSSSLVFLAVIEHTVSKMCALDNTDLSSNGDVNTNSVSITNTISTSSSSSSSSSRRSGQLYFAEWGSLVTMPLVVWSGFVIFMTNQKSLERHNPHNLTMFFVLLTLSGLIVTFGYYAYQLILRPELTSSFASHNTTRYFVEAQWKCNQFK